MYFEADPLPSCDTNVGIDVPSKPEAGAPSAPPTRDAHAPINHAAIGSQNIVSPINLGQIPDASYVQCHNVFRKHSKLYFQDKRVFREFVLSRPLLRRLPDCSS